MGEKQRDRAQLGHPAGELVVCGELEAACTNPHWIFDLPRPNTRIRDVGIGLQIDAVDLAQQLGASTALVPGCDPVESPPSKWELFCDGLLQAIARAERAGVPLALARAGITRRSEGDDQCQTCSLGGRQRRERG